MAEYRSADVTKEARRYICIDIEPLSLELQGFTSAYRNCLVEAGATVETCAVLRPIDSRAKIDEIALLERAKLRLEKLQDDSFVRPVQREATC